MIFSGLKRINNLDFIGARILKLVQNDISYYAMHTNYDVLGMAELSGRKMSLEDPEVLEVTRDGEQPEGIWGEWQIWPARRPFGKSAGL
mgnify:CR=1 FL=1